MDCDITFLPFRRMLTQQKLAKLQSVYQQAQAPLLQVHVYTCIHLNIFIALQCVVYGYISLLTSLTLELKAETRNSIPAPSGSDKVRVYMLHRVYMHCSCSACMYTCRWLCHQSRSQKVLVYTEHHTKSCCAVISTPHKRGKECAFV